MITDTNRAAQIAAYLRANIGHGQDTARIGPFLATFDASSDNRYRNYAVPDDGAEPTAGEVQALIAAFEGRSRVPRLEYVPELAPAVLPALAGAGFTTEGLLPLMACSHVSLRSPAPIEGVEFALAISDADLEIAARTQNDAYGEPETSSADVGRLKRTIVRGGAVAIARAAITREALGSGLYSAPIRDVTEIAAVGVRARFRGRGIGAALTALLASDALARGFSGLFLMAAHDAEARVFARVGFETCGTMLHTSR